MFFRLQLPLRFAPLASLLLASVVFAEEPWETVSTEPLLVKTRRRADTEVKEVWAEGDINAAPVDIQTTVLDADRFTEFMPYMVESRKIGGVDPDGASYTYSKIDVPFVSARDFVHKGYLDRDARKDPQGVFQ